MIKWTVGTKIGGGYALALVILVIVSAVSYQSAIKLTDTADWVTHTHKVLEDLGGLLQALTDAETGQRGFIITGQEPYLEPYQSSLLVIDQNVRELRDLTSDNPHQQRRLDTLEPLLKERAAYLLETIDMQRTKGLEAARQLVSTGQGKKEMDQIRVVIGDMKAEENSLLKIRSDEAQASARNAKMTVIVGTASAFVLLSLVAFIITRNISKPLREITATAGQIAAGNLSISVLTSHRKDEVGVLWQAFSRMAESLRAQIRDLREMINVLGTSANQISTSTTQLAAGATETATAVNQATTTVEEVRQTAQLSSQKAKSVSETAQTMAQISQSGTKSTQETVAGINRIQQQMDSIADTMMRLSEQGQTIGQIVATVEDLASQSNLLAVNAAIEAAKAGDQGKGFAIVAQEVRNLAEQSKQATNQVRAILNDIQKATSAAAMATEQGSKAVEAGVKQAGEAGQSIQTLTSSVTQAAQAATQIAASSQQQLVGVDQVASAMENIKQASSQNMASAKQLEAAAHDIKGLGHKLMQTVERYTV